jgi:hypothetical protein
MPQDWNIGNLIKLPKKGCMLLFRVPDDVDELLRYSIVCH